MGSEDKFDSKKFGEDLRDKIHQEIHDRIHQNIHDRIGRRRGPSAVRSGSGMWAGLILVVIGTVVLLDHMGIISADRFWKLWPLFLIFYGAVRFMEGCNRVFGALVMFIGTLFLLSNYGYFHLSAGDFWPIALIAIGIALIWSRFEVPKLLAGSPGGPNTINEFAMFGGVERRITTSNFVGGSASATFGGVELDFRSADIEGEEAVVYLEALFGGIEVTVPERWMVVWEGQSIFGGYSDETRPPLPDVPGAPPKKRLILRGRAVFGGITLKN